MEFDKRFIGEDTIKFIQDKGLEPIEMTDKQKELFKEFLEKFAGLGKYNENYCNLVFGNKLLDISETFQSSPLLLNFRFLLCYWFNDKEFLII